MLFSKFRIRNTNRDSQTDLDRFRHLSGTISVLAAKIRNEREGLERRYTDAQTSAAFAQAAVEGEGDVRFSTNVDALTTAMARYSTRINELEKQIAFVGELDAAVKEFLDSMPQRFDG